MSVEVRLDNNNTPFILGGQVVNVHDGVIAQDAARATVLAQFTVMAKVAATQKWVPLTSLTATDGSAIAQGIYVGPDIAAADLVAGDVLNCNILVGGGPAFVDLNQLVFDGGTLTLDSVFTGNAVGTGTATPYILMTVRDQLAARGIFAEDSVDITSYENV